MLRDDGVRRPSVSRAYYATYAAVVARLHAQGVDTFGDRSNPSHAEFPSLIRRTVSGVSADHRRNVSKLVRRLRVLREIADYRPGMTLADADRTEALRSMIVVQSLMGVPA
ncbi:MAG: hypothetical protein IPK69_09000 [Phycisphaerales bacterium]|nr:MAG: hypothetical protein IPK69_09000 [Phycisphaerales bacterium]